jgi:hypothetical protein
VLGPPDKPEGVGVFGLPPPPYVLRFIRRIYLIVLGPPDKPEGVGVLGLEGVGVLGLEGVLSGGGRGRVGPGGRVEWRRHAADVVNDAVEAQWGTAVMDPVSSTGRQRG